MEKVCWLTQGLGSPPFLACNDDGLLRRTSGILSWFLLGMEEMVLVSKQMIHSLRSSKKDGSVSSCTLAAREPGQSPW